MRKYQIRFAIADQDHDAQAAQIGHRRTLAKRALRLRMIGKKRAGSRGLRPRVRKCGEAGCMFDNWSSKGLMETILMVAAPVSARALRLSCT